MGNGIFCSAVGVASLFIVPPLSVIPLGVGTIRLHWINQNNKKI